MRFVNKQNRQKKLLNEILIYIKIAKVYSNQRCNHILH